MPDFYSVKEKLTMKRKRDEMISKLRYVEYCCSLVIQVEIRMKDICIIFYLLVN